MVRSVAFAKGGIAMASGLTIGQLAKEVRVNVETVRYYERLKLVTPTARRPSGYRVYGDEAISRLRFIKNAQALGFTLREIAELLNLRVSSKSQCGSVLRKAQAKLTQIEAKAQDLQALARALKDLIRDCRAGQPTDRCPILKSLEEERRSNNGNRKTKG
jgi:MerR family mercuric resistance operon transcriptional regulator/MerR family gold-responsive transcriptional activator of gol and ges genes